MSINRVILTGRLVRDVEFKTLPSGTGVVNNAIAVSHWRKDQSGQSQEQTSFIDVSFFGRTAEIVNQYLRKGSLVGVDGRLEQQSWKDAQTGQNRSKIVVIAESMQMLEPKSSSGDSGGGAGGYGGGAGGYGGGAGGYGAQNHAQPQAEQFAQGANYGSSYGDELPF